MMTKGEIEYAIRKAHENFDRWNDVTGFIPKFSGYYYEALAVVEDAVKIGSRVACHLQIRFDDDGNLIDDDEKETQ